MTAFLWTIFAVTAGLVLYAYAGYPALLALIARWRGGKTLVPVNGELPDISFVVPAYNEADQIRALLDSLLAIDSHHPQMLPMARAVWRSPF